MGVFFIKERVSGIEYPLNINIVLYLLFVSLVIPSVLSAFYPYFPDYNNYNKYISTGSSLERFSVEIGSAYIMHFLNSIGGTASEYYWISTFLFCFCIALVITSFNGWGKVHFSLLLIIFMNPIFLILYQTPRFSSALGFFTLSLFYFRGSWYSLVFVLITASLHTVLGVFCAICVVISYFRWWLQFFSVFFIVAGFYLITTGYIDTNYKVYDVDVYERGAGRTFLFLFNFIVFLFLSYKSKNKHFIRYSILVSFMCLFLYLLTPFAHRMTSIALMILLVLSFSFFNKVRKLIMALALLFQSLLGVYMLKFSLFGFG